MQTWVLLAGLALVFVGVAVAISLAGVIGREKSEISSSLAAIEAIGGPLPDDMRAAYDKPFGTRVAGPFRIWVMDKARMLAGVNWAKNTTRRLEMAGNPPNWSIDRMLSAKVVAAVALGAGSALRPVPDGQAGLGTDRGHRHRGPRLLPPGQHAPGQGQEAVEGNGEGAA